MRLLKVISLVVALTGLVAIAIAAAPSVFGQERRGRELTLLAGRGAAIGVSIRDLNPTEADRQKLAGGVMVEDVRPDSPADKAGVKRSDIIVEYDGERVRSARQFSRLVQETPPGREVKATIVRDGRRADVQITPDDRRADFMVSGDFGDYMRDLGRDLGGLAQRLPDLDFNFDFDMPGGSARRLGVTVTELSRQLADYFGAKEGVLVTSVADGSAAAHAGLRAGDVITGVNGESVRSREDLLRVLRDADRDAKPEVTIAIVRDKKESRVTATIEPRRRALRGRPA